MADHELSRRYHAAHSIALACGDLAMRHVADLAGLGVTMKGDQDWLTIADGAVETIFRELIAEAFPRIVMGEEQGGGESVPDRLWIIDRLTARQFRAAATATGASPSAFSQGRAGDRRHPGPGARRDLPGAPRPWRDAERQADPLCRDRE